MKSKTVQTKGDKFRTPFSNNILTVDCFVDKNGKEHDSLSSQKLANRGSVLGHVINKEFGGGTLIHESIKLA